MGASGTDDTVDGIVFSKRKSSSCKMTHSRSILHSPREDAVDGQFYSHSNSSTAPKDDAIEPWLIPLRYTTCASNIRVVIICNTFFDPRTRQVPREAGECDVRGIVQMCQQLGFRLATDDILMNNRQSEILTKIYSIAAQDHCDTDALMVFVMSHGKEEGLIWARDFLYNVDDLTAAFSPKVAPGLKDKPKLFFIQSCRGDGLDHGALIFEMSDQEAHARHPDFLVPFTNMPDSSVICTNSPTKSHVRAHIMQTPSDADFLVAYSTCEGRYSWRNRFLGSWFIQDLVEVFLAQSYKEDIIALLTEVNRLNAYKRKSNDQTDPRFHQKKQIPCFASTLTKQLFLTP